MLTKMFCLERFSGRDLGIPPGSVTPSRCDARLILGAVARPSSAAPSAILSVIVPSVPATFSTSHANICLNAAAAMGDRMKLLASPQSVKSLPVTV